MESSSKSNEIDLNNSQIEAKVGCLRKRASISMTVSVSPSLRWIEPSEMYSQPIKRLPSIRSTLKLRKVASSTSTSGCREHRRTCTASVTQIVSGLLGVPASSALFQSGSMRSQLHETATGADAEKGDAGASSARPGVDPSAPARGDSIEVTSESGRQESPPAMSGESSPSSSGSRTTQAPPGASGESSPSSSGSRTTQAPPGASVESSPSSSGSETTKALVESAGTLKAHPRLARIRVDPSASSLERNFVTPCRAMSDFLLRLEHLRELKATKRRSPYVDEPPITVYWRKDVERKAIEVWGSRDALLRAVLRGQLERKFAEQSRTTLKRQLKSSRRSALAEPRLGLRGPSGRVVLSAVLVNGANFACKLVTWLWTGSHSMFAECVHSLADTVNQLILAYGIHKSVQRPNPSHPYGYTNMGYVSSLISGVAIFCGGTGLSVYHGVVGLLEPHELDSYYWAFVILAGSLMSEGATCLVALSSLRRGALGSGLSVREYVLSGQDPSVNVVLLEDCAALLSVAVTGSCIGLAVALGSPWPDAVGSLLVGGILGAVASFIIRTNVTALVGRSIPRHFLEKINYELESDVMVRGIHDVKGIDMGSSLIRYKAEVDFDGRELTRLYLDHQDLQSMLEQVRGMKSIDEFESFLLQHSENIVDSLGSEIDRIEVKLRKKYPQIRHCDLEIL